MTKIKDELIKIQYDGESCSIEYTGNEPFDTTDIEKLKPRVTERFKLIDEKSGTLEYVGAKPFHGRLIYEFRATDEQCCRGTRDITTHLTFDE